MVYRFKAGVNSLNKFKCSFLQNYQPIKYIIKMKKIIDEDAAFISVMCCLFCMCAFALGFVMGKSKCESYVRKEYSEVLLDYDRALNQAGYYYENEILDVQIEHDDWKNSEEQKSWNVYCDAKENISLFKQNHK